MWRSAASRATIVLPDVVLPSRSDQADLERRTDQQRIGALRSSWWDDAEPHRGRRTCPGSSRARRRTPSGSSWSWASSMSTRVSCRAPPRRSSRRSTRASPEQSRLRQERAVRVDARDRHRDLPHPRRGARGPVGHADRPGAHAPRAWPGTDGRRRASVLPLAATDGDPGRPVPGAHREVPVAGATADHLRAAHPRGRPERRPRDRSYQRGDMPAAALPGPVGLQSLLAGSRHRAGVSTQPPVGVGAVLGTTTTPEQLVGLPGPR